MPLSSPRLYISSISILVQLLCNCHRCFRPSGILCPKVSDISEACSPEASATFKPFEIIQMYSHRLLRFDTIESEAARHYYYVGFGGPKAPVFDGDRLTITSHALTRKCFYVSTNIYSWCSCLWCMHGKMGFEKILPTFLQFLPFNNWITTPNFLPKSVIFS